MTIAIYASDQQTFNKSKQHLAGLGFLTEKIIFVDSNYQTRLDCIKKFPNEWLLFLDHDCVLTAEQLNKIFTVQQEIQLNHNSNVVVAGLYTDSEDSSALQKAHNWIANTWLGSSYEKSNTPYILGGIFLVYSSVSGFESNLEVGVWGAEDKQLAEILQKSGFSFFFRPKMQTQHFTSKKISHFLKRAYLHGVNDAKYFNHSQQDSNFLYWLYKIDFSNVRLVALVLLHFVVQKTAKIFQTIRQLNK